MRILITNDDGINAPGLKVLQDIAAQLSSDCWVVAPDLDQSGASHSLTLREPIRMRPIEERIYSVRGTPTDCVIMGVGHLLKDKPPALVLSGVNRGANMAEDVTYSGTIAGAMEGTVLGIRSIALSQATNFDRSGKSTKWGTALRHGPPLIRRLLETGWPQNGLLNVNFPDREPDDVVGIAITAQGRRDLNQLRVEERADMWGSPYFWFGFERQRSNAAEGSDLAAVYGGSISVTPLSLDLTDQATRAAFARIPDFGVIR